MPPLSTIGALALLALLVMQTGCITLGKELYRDNIAPKPTPTPIPDPTPIPTTAAAVTPAPTPTIDPGEAFIKSGGLNLSQWFTFSRRTFRDRVEVHAMVYRFQVRTYYRIDTPDLDIWKVPERPRPGYKFLFIWVRMVSTGTTPMGGYNPADFSIQYKGRSFAPISEPNFIYELSSYSSFDHKEITAPFGYFYGTDTEMNKYNLTIKKRHFIPLPEFNPGESNAWDGYIIYEIPGQARNEDLIIVGSFDRMFTARWRLQGGDVFCLPYPPVVRP